MHENYSDIRERIAEEPTWYDHNGTPRYGEFHPQQCPDIYAHQCVLLRIACQYCGEEFDVELCGGVFYPITNPSKLHYGDPPIHENSNGEWCSAGNTMNCEDLAVLQVWDKPSCGEWERHTELEGTIDG